ncbi:MAG: hypothetical protein NWR72_12225 [Bacteroidia bacterium]|nr:hypothetical protein [Bacteroidia bacterium]
MIEAEDFDGRFCDKGKGHKFWTIDKEMRPPTVSTRVKESDEFVIGEQHGADVAAFVAVAGEASQGKIIGMVIAGVLEADDMIDFVWKKGILL